MNGSVCVLLSGGMDSVCCLHWALRNFKEVRALCFDYGQPHRDAELCAAGVIAARRHVPLEVVALADALDPQPLRDADEHEPHLVEATGLHRAFIPGRNLVFLSLALSRAAVWSSHGAMRLVIGCTQEDLAGFPDTQPAFTAAAADALSRAVSRRVFVDAPYANMLKATMLLDLSDEGRDDVAESWSCYTGRGPCGQCTPCVLRCAAFRAAGIQDRASVPKMRGGT